MDQQLAPAELLRFLQAEAETLQQIQVKISNELHLLQVEEEVFVRTVERLNENGGRNRCSTTTTKGTTGAGMELLEALHQELASAVPLVSTEPPDSAPSTTPSEHFVSSLPPDPALPTTLHANYTETEIGGDAGLEVEPQSAAPDVGFDDDAYEYELLDRLESEDE